MSNEDQLAESYKNSDLSDLSEEEAAALAGSDDESVEENGEEIEQDQESDVQAEAGSETDAEESADEAASPEEDDEKQPFVPQYQIDTAEEVAGIEEALAALDAKFEEGELSATEYRKALAEINNPVLIAEAKRAAMQEISQQNTEQLWKRQQDEFFELYPNYRDSKIKFAGIEVALQDLYADEKNAGKSGAWFLREAKASVDRELGIKAESHADLSRRKPDLPTSLGNLPSADSESTGDKYSALDHLSGLELEMAIAKLSDADLDAFGRAH